MKNYLKKLQQSGIDASMIDQLAQAMVERAAVSAKPHPISVYHALATDIALGAVETCEDSEQELGKTHSAKEWLEIITNVSFS